MAYTQLSLSATPGKRYSFSAKTEAVITAYVLVNFDAIIRAYNFKAKNRTFGVKANSRAFNFDARTEV